jgi:hypothetical protein
MKAGIKLQAGKHRDHESPKEQEKIKTMKREENICTFISLLADPFLASLPNSPLIPHRRAYAM